MSSYKLCISFYFLRNKDETNFWVLEVSKISEAMAWKVGCAAFASRSIDSFVHEAFLVMPIYYRNLRNTRKIVCFTKLQNHLYQEQGKCTHWYMLEPPSLLSLIHIIASLWLGSTSLLCKTGCWAKGRRFFDNAYFTINKHESQSITLWQYALLLPHLTLPSRHYQSGWLPTHILLTITMC